MSPPRGCVTGPEDVDVQRILLTVLNSNIRFVLSIREQGTKETWVGWVGPGPVGLQCDSGVMGSGLACDVDLVWWEEEHVSYQLYNRKGCMREEKSDVISEEGSLPCF